MGGLKQFRVCIDDVNPCNFNSTMYFEGTIQFESDKPLDELGLNKKVSDVLGQVRIQSVECHKTSQYSGFKYVVGYSKETIIE
jgi:hypothetical protein